MSTTAVEREPQDIHSWFGLTYSNYLVLPRSLMQSMPKDWQHRASALFDEMHEAYSHLEWPEYKVVAGKWCYIDDLSEADLKALGVSGCCDDGPAHGCEGADEHRCSHFLDGEELDHNSACVFAPGNDPIPHYDRGRTHVPRKDELPATT